jgi:hypothetical protein
VFRRGETTAICLAALRDEGPLDTRELAVRMMRAKGLDTSDKVLSATVALRIVQTLRMKAKRKQIDGTLRRKGVCLWRLPTASIAGASDCSGTKAQGASCADDESGTGH